MTVIEQKRATPLSSSQAGEHVVKAPRPDVNFSAISAGVHVPLLVQAKDDKSVFELGMMARVAESSGISFSILSVVLADLPQEGFTVLTSAGLPLHTSGVKAVRFSRCDAYDDLGVNVTIELIGSDMSSFYFLRYDPARSLADIVLEAVRAHVDALRHVDAPDYNELLAREHEQVWASCSLLLYVAWIFQNKHDLDGLSPVIASSLEVTGPGVWKADFLHESADDDCGMPFGVLVTSGFKYRLMLSFPT